MGQWPMAYGNGLAREKVGQQHQEQTSGQACLLEPPCFRHARFLHGRALDWTDAFGFWPSVQIWSGDEF